MTNSAPNPRLKMIAYSLGAVQTGSILPLCAAWQLCGVIRIKNTADAALILSESSKIVWC